MIFWGVCENGGPESLSIFDFAIEHLGEQLRILYTKT